MPTLAWACSRRPTCPRKRGHAARHFADGVFHKPEVPVLGGLPTVGNSATRSRVQPKGTNSTSTSGSAESTGEGGGGPAIAGTIRPLTGFLPVSIFHCGSSLALAFRDDRLVLLPRRCLETDPLRADLGRQGPRFSVVLEIGFRRVRQYLAHLGLERRLLDPRQVALGNLNDYRLAFAGERKLADWMARHRDRGPWAFSVDRQGIVPGRRGIDFPVEHGKPGFLADRFGRQPARSLAGLSQAHSR